MPQGSTSINLAPLKSTVGNLGGPITPPVNIAFVGVLPVTEQVNEGAQIVIEIKRNGKLDLACSVQLDLFNPIGGQPGFVLTDSQIVNIPSGTPSRQIALNTVNEPGTQGSRIVRVSLSNEVNCVIVDNQREAQVTINDVATATASLSIAASPAAVVVEPNTGTALARFLVTRGGDTTVACSCRWTRSGTTAAEDFLNPPASPGTVSFAVDVTQQFIDHNIQADALVESSPSETLIVTIDQPVNCVIPTGTNNATITFTDQDVAVRPRFDVVAQQADVDESFVGSPIGFFINRSAETTLVCSVGWSVALSAGLAANDFAVAPVLSGTANFASGITQVAVNYQLLDDTTVEGSEVLTITIANPSANADLGTQLTATVTINDNDSAPGGVEVIPELRRIFARNNAELFNDVLGTSSGNFPSNITVTGTDRSAPIKAGDHIRLSPGTYSGNATITINGTATAPIYIRADNEGNPPVFIGSLQLGNASNGSNGQYIILRWLEFQQNRNGCTLRGKGSTLQRCRLSNVVGIGNENKALTRVWVLSGLECSIQFCDITDIDCVGIGCPGNAAVRPYVYRTLFHDSNVHASSKSNEGIQFGYTDGDSPPGPTNQLSNYYMDGLAEQSYWLNYQQGSGNSDNECISVKSSGNVILQCVLDNSRKFTNRHGFYNDQISCISKNGSEGMNIKGTGDVIANNQCASGAGTITIDSGNHYQEDGPVPEGNRASCRECLVISNDATVEVGKPGGTSGVTLVDAQDNRVENNGSRIVRTQTNYGHPNWETNSSFREERTTWQNVANRDYPTRTVPAGMTPANCGRQSTVPFAPSRNFGAVPIDWRNHGTSPVPDNANQWTVWGGEGDGTGVTVANPTSDGMRFYGGPTPSNDSHRLLAWLNNPLPAGDWMILMEYKRVDSADPRTGIASQFWLGRGINAFPAGIITATGNVTNQPTIAGVGDNVDGMRLTFNTDYNSNNDLNWQVRMSVLPADEYHHHSPARSNVSDGKPRPGGNFPFTVNKWYQIELQMYKQCLRLSVKDIAAGTATKFRMYGGFPTQKVFGIYLQPYRDVRIRKVRVYKVGP